MAGSCDHSNGRSAIRRSRHAHRGQGRAVLHGLAAWLAFVLVACPPGALAATGSGLFMPDVTTPLPRDLRPVVEPERREESGASVRASVPLPVRAVPFAFAFGSLLLLYGLGRGRRSATPAPGT